jgi:predicted DNA-binding protein (MmcQ/YjbR family)
MSPADFDAAARTLKGATMDVQWGADQVYKIGGKMFAVMGPEGSWSCKVSDIAFEALTAEGPGKPAPYMARAMWVWFPSLDVMPGDETRGLLANAHRLITGKLTRKARAELGL